MGGSPRQPAPRQPREPHTSGSLERRLEELEKELLRERQENNRLLKDNEENQDLIGKLKEEIDLLNRVRVSLSFSPPYVCPLLPCPSF